MRSPCGRVRLPLNTSQDRDTVIAQALSSYRGPGVHHVAFACDDIFAEVARAQAAGVPLLEIPRNYYDDLPARFDFAHALLAERARYNVLSARDTGGSELLQLQHDPVAGHFVLMR